MRIARDFGTVDQLLPDGIDDVRDCPHVLFQAVRTALMVLSFEELPRDERPPKRIWLDGERLSTWFKEVERRRDAKYGTGKDETIEDPVENDAARLLVVG